ncbi:NEAT domain-containing protein [Sporosarcina sp. Te-1]|uniref:NEAT domain-containing protein n=1 Tax=Sporosarcina sp. Te-1 TaxID=2818390 RepID=UPI001A9E2D80|nr:NEAT domain-containing protein [Sporosarcina sp. Te-1]QTD40875.1 NEAT domain-containing protein [Sporosarcina sp. Te-1]
MKTKTLFSMAITCLLAIFIPLMPMQASAATIFADGEYTVPFTVLKGTGNEQSTTADYMVSPAKVHIRNGKATVTVTLNNSSWWQYFKVQSGGGFKDVQVVSENRDTDKRTVKFDVADLGQMLNGKIHVIVTGIPGFEYDHKYDIRFSFNTSGIPEAPAEKPVTNPPANVSKPEVKPESKPETKPVAMKKPEEKPAQKPTEQKTERVKEKKDVVRAEEKADSKQDEAMKSEQETEDKAQSDKREAEDAVGEGDKTEETSGDVTTADEQVDTVVEEVTADDKAVGAAMNAKEESSSSTLLIALVAIVAVIIGGIAFAAVKKRARK